MQSAKKFAAQDTVAMPTAVAQYASHNTAAGEAGVMIPSAHIPTMMGHGSDKKVAPPQKAQNSLQRKHTAGLTAAVKLYT